MNQSDCHAPAHYCDDHLARLCFGTPAQDRDLCDQAGRERASSGVLQCDQIGPGRKEMAVGIQLSKVGIRILGFPGAVKPSSKEPDNAPIVLIPSCATMVAAVQRECDDLRGETLNRLLAIRQLRPLIFECLNELVDARQLVERELNVC
jgi:hypothetical protein